MWLLAFLFLATVNIVAPCPCAFRGSNAKCYVDDASAVVRCLSRNITSLMYAFNNMRAIPENAFHAFPDLTTLFISEYANEFQIYRELGYTLYPKLKDFHNLEVNSSLGQIIRSNISRFHKDIFKSNPKLKHLTLWMKLQSVNPRMLELNTKLETFEYVGSGFDAIYKETFIANGLMKTIRIESKVQTIHKEAFWSNPLLESLTLANNRIGFIERETFKNTPNLKYLDLAENDIEVLLVETFRTTTNLTYLDLSWNKIRVLEGALFRYTNKLKELQIGYNNISSIPAISLSQLRSLRILNFKQNKIQELDRNVFKFNVMLVHINAGYNKLQFLDPNIFQFNHHLSELLLSGNDIVFGNTSFRQVNSLKRLDISSNNLSSVPTDLLRSLPNLESLSLSYNHITYVSNDSFTGNPRLQSLYLNFNHIRNLPRDAFSNNRALRRLSVSFNLLSSLRLDTIPSLKEVWLYGNPWHCDCSLQPLVDLLNLLHVKGAHGAMTCTTPVQFSGFDIRRVIYAINCSDVDDDDLDLAPRTMLTRDFDVPNYTQQ